MALSPLPSKIPAKKNPIAHVTHVAHAHVGWVSIVALRRKYATFAVDNTHTLFTGIIALVQAAKTQAATLDAKIISLEQAAKTRTATIHATLRASTISWTALNLYVYSIFALFGGKVFWGYVPQQMCYKCKTGWASCCTTEPSSRAPVCKNCNSQEEKAQCKANNAKVAVEKGVKEECTALVKFVCGENEETPAQPPLEEQPPLMSELKIAYDRAMQYTYTESIIANTVTTTNIIILLRFLLLLAVVGAVGCFLARDAYWFDSPIVCI